MKIGTRESRLALRQTEIFVGKLIASSPETRTEIISMKSLGDIDLKSPLSNMSAVGAFVRELDEALVAERIDVSVNSLKDVPTKMDSRLTVAAILERDSDRDVILPCPLEALPEGATVGTSSVRREMMLREARPDIAVKPLRGNIHTRLSKLDAGEYDAIILAKAGLERMGIDRPSFTLDESVFIPAPAQGAIAAECRADDAETIDLLKTIDHADTRAAVEAERAVMRTMGAGCSSPVGINARPEGDKLRIRAVSYGYTDSPRRTDITIPKNWTERDILHISDYLTGKNAEL